MASEVPDRRSWNQADTDIGPNSRVEVAGLERLGRKQNVDFPPVISPKNKIAEDAGVLRESFPGPNPRWLRLLRRGLGCLLLGLGLAFPAADERQGVRGIEGELAN